MYFVCIYHTSTGPDTCHIHHTSAQEYKTKSLKQGPRSSKTACEPFKNKPKQRNGTQPVQKLPPPPSQIQKHTHTQTNKHTHTRVIMQPCTRVCVHVYECVCVCLAPPSTCSLVCQRKRWRFRVGGWVGGGEPPSCPQAILNILRPCTTGGTGSGGGIDEAAIKKNAGDKGVGGGKRTTGRRPRGSASDLDYRLSLDKHYQATTVKTSTVYFKQEYSGQRLWPRPALLGPSGRLQGGAGGWSRVQTAGWRAAEECVGLLNQDCASVTLLLLSGRRAR